MEKYLDKNGVITLLQGIKTKFDTEREELLNSKGVVNGFASLDENGNVPLSQLGNVDTDIYEIAQDFPTQLTEKQSKHIFLIPRGTDEVTNRNIYKEYIYIGSDIENVIEVDWEQIGEFTTSVDLKEYAKKNETILPSSVIFKRINEGGELALVYKDAEDNLNSHQAIIPRVNSGNNNDGLMTSDDKYKLDQIDLAALNTSINAANAAADSAKKVINTTEAAEAKREEAEKKRQTDTAAAISSMDERVNTAINEFNSHRTDFNDEEAARVEAENNRVEAENLRQQAETKRTTAEDARVKAETKRENDFTTASAAAQTAITGAENVNATLTEKNIFEVTDRTGVKKTLDLNVTDGTPAGFGQIAATVENSVGTPNVVVTTSGTNEAKNISFAFSGLKGETGPKGDPGEIGPQGPKGDGTNINTINATIDDVIGTPSVKVTSTGDSAAQDVVFVFSGLKGAKGDTGNTGETGQRGSIIFKANVDVLTNGTVTSSDLVIPTGITPAINDFILDTNNDIYSITNVNSETYTVGELVSNIKGEQGIQGLQGPKGDAFAYSDFTSDQLAALKGPKGDKGEQGEQGLQGIQGIQGIKGNPFTYDDFTEAQIKELQKPATDAATELGELKKRAEIAINGAETVNAKLENYILSVTDREGNTSEINLNADETVNLTITSLVEDIKVAEMKVNVYLNNGKIPTTYTTDSNGHITFNVERGTLYRIEFNEYGNAQPISPISYTATSGMVREISVEYKPYDEESSEKVIVTVKKYTDGVGSAWEGITVNCTIDSKTTPYSTDSNGHVTIYVPYNKKYTIIIDDQDGYNVSFNKNSRTYTANVPQRIIDYRFYQFKAGIFVVDANKNEYYIEDWVAAGRNADDAVAIKVADASLSINHSTFCIRTSDIKNVLDLISLPWCTKSLQFNSIALNGNNVNDANYYNGESSSFLIRQESQERSLSVPAFDYAYNQIFTIGGEELHGFVMSVGQEREHIINIDIIKQVLETLFDGEVATNYYNFVMKKARWTSTQYSISSTWIYSSSMNYANKSSNNVILPVFAC